MISLNTIPLPNLYRIEKMTIMDIATISPEYHLVASERQKIPPYKTENIFDECFFIV
jgi:hypothetical protein